MEMGIWGDFMLRLWINMTHFHNDDISRVRNDSISGLHDHFMG